uniref:CS domain-containing protein n=1 Tax=Florenciella parvula TaxID=236787 RepID=A0A6T7E0F6_9STRA
MAAVSDALTAPVKWAQRADSLYVTIALPDVKDEKIELTKDKLSFKGTAGGKEYFAELEFLKPVNPEDEGTKWKCLPRSIQMVIMKETEEEEFWVRLLKDKVQEKGQCSIDWDKYVDEDDEQEAFDQSNLEGAQGFGGGGPPGMGGMGGMGGMPGMGGGPGGAGGMDMAAMQQMMAQMGGGAGGAGGMDMASMMAGMGGGGPGGMPPGMGDMGGFEDEADSDDEGGLPDLDDDGEEAEALD